MELFAHRTNHNMHSQLEKYDLSILCGCWDPIGAPGLWRIHRPAVVCGHLDRVLRDGAPPISPRLAVRLHEVKPLVCRTSDLAVKSMVLHKLR